jgi:hypothetical protein
MTPRLKLCALLTILLVACNRDRDGGDTVVVDSAAGTKPLPVAPPDPAPRVDEQVWVVLFKLQGGSTEFFDRLILRQGRLESRDGLARGFAATGFSAKPDEGLILTAEQESPREGKRTWSCLGTEYSASMLCTLSWTHGGKTETYTGDAYERKEDPFRGKWSITLSPKDDVGATLSGEADFDRGALDLSIGAKSYKLVYFVRPAEAHTPVDFLTGPTDGPVRVGWNGALMRNGSIVGWGEPETDAKFTVGGELTIGDDKGNSTTYRVSSEPREP